jgi:hypothetical protein
VSGDLTSAFDFKNPDTDTVGLIKKDFKVRGPIYNKAQPTVQSDYKTNLPKVENPLNLFDHKTSDKNATARRGRCLMLLT